MGLGRDRRVNHRRNICPPVGCSPCVVYEWPDWLRTCGYKPVQRIMWVISRDISRTPNRHPIACGIRAPHKSPAAAAAVPLRSGGPTTIAHTSCAVSRFSLRLKSSCARTRFIRSGQGYAASSSYGRCVNVRILFRSEMTAILSVYYNIVIMRYASQK